ncbi:MAG: BadF/BadG/BcrA/BcrD ATPase family protein [Vicinamibacteraceae bacterium]
MSVDLHAPYVLGFDAGGTKTVCLLADLEGHVLDEARTNGANLQAVGELEVETTLHEVMDLVIGDRMLPPSAIVLGMAGVDRADDAQVMRRVLRRIGAKARTLITNDALIALVAAIGHDPGIVLIAGTGSIAYGRNARDEAARAGGWGYVLGDEGSGYWIGRHALRAVVRASDGRGHPTAMTPLVLAHFGVTHPDDLVRVIYDGALRPPAIAAVARAVQAAAEEHDELALQILTVGARELASSARSVIARLGLRDEVFDVVLSGGVMHAVPRLAAEVEAQVQQLAPKCRVQLLQREPAYGAVALAVAEATGGARVPSYATA